MRLLIRLALGGLALLVGARLWSVVSGRRRGGAYYLTGARQVRLLFWPLAGLVAALPFVLGVARRAVDLPPVPLAVVLILGLLLLSLSVPALVLHARYRAHDAETVVLFDRRAPLLEVRRPDRPQFRFRPGEVLTAVHTRPRGAGAFWSNYETLHLTFINGHPPLALTSAVLDLVPVVQWLRQHGVTVTERRRALAWV